MKPLKFIELFSGIGGFRLGLEALGHKCVFSSEIDKYARQTYKANFGDEPHGDITQIDAKDIPDHDILTGGFPCQAFSVAGHRKGFDDTRGTLFFEIARIIKYKKPEWLLLENVPGLLSHNQGQTFATIIQVLEQLGYGIDHKILNTKDFGPPQSRRRVFIVGKLGADLFWKFAWPQPTLSGKCVADIMEAVVDEKYFISVDKAKKAAEVKSHPNKWGKVAVPDDISKPSRCLSTTQSPTSFDIILVPEVKDYNGSGQKTAGKKASGLNVEGFLPDVDYANDRAVYSPSGKSPTLKASGKGGKLFKVGHIGKGGQGNRVYDSKGLAQTQSAVGGGQGAKTGLYKVARLGKKKMQGYDILSPKGIGQTLMTKASGPSATGLYKVGKLKGSKAKRHSDGDILSPRGVSKTITASHDKANDTGLI